MGPNPSKVPKVYTVLRELTTKKNFLRKLSIDKSIGSFFFSSRQCERTIPGLLFFPVNHSHAQHSGGFDNPRSVSACVPEAFCTINFTFFSLLLSLSPPHLLTGREGGREGKQRCVAKQNPPLPPAVLHPRLTP